MAEGNAQSKYVKLTKDQAPLEDITPGELNQPIEVPQVLPFIFYLFILMCILLSLLQMHLVVGSR